MIDAHINNPKSPKYYVKKHLDGQKDQLRGKIVLDVPAGNGATTEILLAHGALVEPFDLFPEYFMLKGIECKRADIMEKIPVADGHADMLVCQEGIEHFSDQLKAFKEFNRVLKPNGRLLLTTPSASSLAAKLSHLLFESETARQMPPNEIDDIWMSDKSVSSQIYHGHIFLIGLQRLRILAKLAGFRIREVKYVRLSKGSLFLFPFFYPLILLSSYFRYYRSLARHKEIPAAYKLEVYREQLQMNLDPKNLVNKHTFIIFEKEKELKEVDFRAAGVMKSFDKIM
ncbi:class I SAM-dependent methyltransferase [candidate division TA06 bacterium]|nr:class I SAM-dependent methyltransferase [candidate division TA06 bacterium]